MHAQGHCSSAHTKKFLQILKAMNSVTENLLSTYVSTRGISFLRAEYLSDKKPAGLLGRHCGCNAAWQLNTGAVCVWLFVCMLTKLLVNYWMDFT